MLGSDLASITDAGSDQYMPFSDFDIDCDFNPPSTCKKITDYIMQVTIDI